MELLSWEYDSETWNDLRHRRRVYLRRRGIMGEEPVGGELTAEPPGRVVLTSTGVINGDTALPWRTWWFHLNEIYMVTAGCQVLVITFIHKWGISGRKVVIPLPPALVEHVRGAMEELVPRTYGQRPVQVIDAQDCDLDVLDADASGDPVARNVEWTPIQPGGAPRPTHYLVFVNDDRAELRPHGIHAKAVFDKRNGVYWKGHVQALARTTPLHAIHALQLVSEALNLNTFVSWELNLVLKEGRRINVVDYGDWTAMLADAEKLADFLHVPLWKGA